MRVLFRRTVKRRRNYFALYGATHVGNFFRTLVNEQHDQFHFWVILFNARCNRLHDRGLTGLRRRHDNSALSLSDWRDEVDDARSHVVWICSIFETQLGVWKQWREVFKARTVLHLVRCNVVDGLNIEHCWILFIASSRLRHA